MRPEELAVAPSWVPHGARTKDVGCYKVDIPTRRANRSSTMQPPRWRPSATRADVDLALRGRRAVVTGGSKEIGLAVARELVDEGVAVAICARNRDEVKAAEVELTARGRQVYAATADVTRPDQIVDSVESCAASLGGL